LRNGSTILLNPLFPVLTTFLGGFLVWYFFMPESSFVPGIAPRHASPDSYFRAFVAFSAFLGGMVFANGPRRRGQTLEPISDNTWLTICWALCVIVLIADYLYLRSGFGAIGDSDTTSYVDQIHSFANTVRDESSFGVTSLNNLFPIPLYVGATLAMTTRRVGILVRLQGMAIALTMSAMTLLHGAVGFGRIWFLFTLLCIFAAWVIERRPPLKRQIVTVLIVSVVAAAFIFIMELLRNVGLTAQATNLDFTDPRILRLAFLTLTQAYVASDINNAMIVFDCHPPMQMISTIDVAAKSWSGFGGGPLASYSDCVGWTSMFGTVDFLAMLWWDWGYMALIVAFAIGFAIQSSYRVAMEPRNGIAISRILFPNVLFGAMHLTRSMFIGNTEFIIPAGALLTIYAIDRLGALTGPALETVPNEQGR
jgi:hypothetical protein